MRHLGDITKINGAEIEPVDVITFGSPCQDLSIAGKRMGLAGNRSGLYIEAVRVISEMYSSTRGEYPKFVVFENVPGMLSSNNGEDFVAALDMMTEIGFIPDPQIHDAQYCGVPQRRRRIGIVWANIHYLLSKRTIISDSIMLQCLTEILLIDWVEACARLGIAPKKSECRAKLVLCGGSRVMDKEQTAMERLRLASDMSLRLYHRPLLLTDSGGKDSAVICKLAENAGIPFEIVHSHTTADAPETVYHVRKRAREYELKGIKYTIHYPTYKGEATSMWKLIPIKLMPPTRIVRYCCAVLKETTGRDRFIVTGVRWAESTARKNSRSSLEIIHSDRKKTLLLNNDNDEDRRLFETCTLKGKRVCNPIIDWQETDVWDYLTDQSVECNPLYCEGWHRVGCVGCPMAAKARYREFAQYPKYRQMYINAFDRMIAERIRRGKMDDTWRMSTTGVDVFHWWMEDGVLPGQMNIDDIETEGSV